MIADSLLAAASENLRVTYFELGRSSPMAKVSQEPGFEVCLGEIEHPICNFAASLNLDRHSAAHLARLALDRHSFNVYVTATDRPANAGDLLIREGFHRSFRLAQMVAQPEDPQPKGNLTRATSVFDRIQIAEFMFDQFFARTGEKFRQPVSEASARALALEMLAMKRDRRIVAAAMISLNCGVVGIYNVCVDSTLRGLGIGTALVREILAMCAVKKAPAALQCDPKLERWYTSLGFRRTGEVDVYALPKPHGLAIIQAF